MDTGDTAWLLMSTALVMIMLPGLALFYGGLVRRKNVLSTIMHSFFGLALVSVVWVIVGFTLAFGPDVTLPTSARADRRSRLRVLQRRRPRAVGDLRDDRAVRAVRGVPADVRGHHAGAHHRRLRRAQALQRVRAVHDPVVDPSSTRRSPTGSGRPTAGCSSSARSTSPAGRSSTSAPGVSALVVALLIGRRAVNGEPMEPHDVPMTVLGAGLLWFGWFGFNAGSAVAANGLAANAFIVTNTAAAAATITWVLAELPPQAQGQRRRCRLRRGRRPRRHHPGVGLRRCRRRADHRPRRRRPVLQRHAAALAPQDRRRARRLRGPRRRRHVRRGRDRRLRHGRRPGGLHRPARGQRPAARQPAHRGRRHGRATRSSRPSSSSRSST